MVGAILAAAMLMMQAQPAATPDNSMSAEAKPADRTVAPVTVSPEKKGRAVDKTQVVCHKEPVLGSMFPKEVCASRQALEERRQQDQQNLREWVALKPYKSN